MDAATLTIRDAARLTNEQASELADWLRNHADDLIRERHEYNERFTGHFVIRSYGNGDDQH